MTKIGKPIRKIEAWPVELPITRQIPEREPKPERVPEPKKVEVIRAGSDDSSVH